MEAPTLARTSVPKLTPWIDPRSLVLDAREGFFLSRIDGYTSLGDLAVMTNTGLEGAIAIAEKLRKVLAIYFGDRPPEKPAPPEERPVVVAAEAAPLVRKKRPRRFTDEELAQPSDLDEEFRIDVLDLHSWLDEYDHYELLNVPREADRKAIKTAYYGLAARFHTDRYYGKNLGPFKAKMEQVFARITTAHDTLASKQRRADYDAYLADLDRTRAFERYLNDEPDEAAAEVPPLDAPTVPVAVETPKVEVPVPATPEPPKVGLDERARREALARKLSGRSSMNLRSARPFAGPPGSNRPSAPPQSTAPPPPRPLAPSTPPTAEQSQAAAAALKRRYEDGVEFARRTQARRLIDEAMAASDRGDVLGAANNYRLAVRYTDDPTVLEAAEIASQRAKDLMADTYLKQAKYEEQSHKFGAAALSYAKAAEGRPEDAQLCADAARCLKTEGRDLHKAAHYAQLAVQKNPSHAPFRVTLGAIYLDAGLFLRARSELEQATKLDPNHREAKELLARARRLAS